MSFSANTKRTNSSGPAYSIECANAFCSRSSDLSFVLHVGLAHSAGGRVLRLGMVTEACDPSTLRWEVQGYLQLHIVSSRPVWVSLDLVFKKEKKRKKKTKVNCCMLLEYWS